MDREALPFVVAVVLVPVTGAATYFVTRDPTILVVTVIATALLGLHERRRRAARQGAPAPGPEQDR